MTTIKQRTLLAVAAHRALKYTQLRTLLGSNEANQRKAVQQLRDDGLIATHRLPIPGTTRSREAMYYLTPAGRKAVSGSPDLDNGRPPYLYEPASIKHGNHSHTIGINDVGISFAADPRSSAVVWTNEVGHRYGSPARSFAADAVITADLRRPNGAIHTLRLFLEYDRGTKPLDRLLKQTAEYLEYRTSDAWTSTYRPILNAGGGFPMLLFVFDVPENPHRIYEFTDMITSPNRAPGLAQAIQARQLPMRVTTLRDLHAAGPWGPAYLDPSTVQSGNAAHTPRTMLSLDESAAQHSA